MAAAVWLKIKTAQGYGGLIEGRASAQQKSQLLGWLFKFGSPTWARTRDLRINSPSLYRLSYQGMECIIAAEILLSSAVNQYRQCFEACC